LDRSYLWLYVFGQNRGIDSPIKRAQFAKQKVEIFKPAIDTLIMKRWLYHMMQMKFSTPVPAAANIAILAQGCDVVGLTRHSF
jgi:thymidine kinase